MDYETLSRNYYETEIELKKTIKLLTKSIGSNKSEWLTSSRRDESQHAFQMRRTDASKHVITKHCYPRKSPEADEISEDEPAFKKVTLPSSVSKVEIQKSRKEVIFSQNSNCNIRSRNRRMFGMVQNTLKKFKDEQLKREPQESKRMKILEKVEAAAEVEKEFIKNQKTELLSKAKEKQRELRCLKKMMRVTKSFEIWETSQKNLSNFILSKTKPKIYFLPARLTSKTSERLKRSRDANKDKIEKQRTAMEVALAKIKESYNVSASSVNKQQTAKPVSLPKTKESHDISSTSGEKERKATQVVLANIKESFDIYTLSGEKTSSKFEKLSERNNVLFSEDPTFAEEALNLGISDDFLFF